jgi:hypothetical protein
MDRDSDQIEFESDVMESDVIEPMGEPISDGADSVRDLMKNASDRLADMPKPISPATHAVLDYTVAAVFFGAGAFMLRRKRRAGMLAMANGAMVLAMSMFTDYPGGVWPRLSFKGHRAGDIGQALFAGLGPVLFGFAGAAEATFFHAQALSEIGVIAATDWDAA